jgi:DNA primase
MVDYRDKILNIAQELDFFVREGTRSLILRCPNCGKEKLYVDKEHGNFICFSGSCGIKGQAAKLISLMRGIDFKDAVNELFGKKEYYSQAIIDITLFLETELEKPAKGFIPIKVELPKHFFKITDPKCEAGRLYLQSRGIGTDIAEKYNITYSPIYERVIFPIMDMNGHDVIGYQGRAISKDVLKGARMLNNTGFRKGKTFMFLNLAINSDHIIVTEGPVDAMKFDMCGGNIASLGKDITNDQLEILNNLKADRIYWALDDDADNLISEYSTALDKKSFMLKVPDRARDRILALGRDKVDFGECTYEECLEAFKNAVPVGGKIFI